MGQIHDQYRSYLWTDHVHAGMPSGIIQNGVRYCKRRPLIQVSNYIGSNVGSTFFIDLEWLRNANSNEINVSNVLTSSFCTISFLMYKNLIAF